MQKTYEIITVENTYERTLVEAESESEARIKLARGKFVVSEPWGSHGDTQVIIVLEILG